MICVLIKFYLFTSNVSTSYEGNVNIVFREFYFKTRLFKPKISTEDDTKIHHNFTLAHSMSTVQQTPTSSTSTLNKKAAISLKLERY